MIVSHLTCLLIIFNHADCYRYLPEHQLPLYSYGTRNVYHAYIATRHDLPFHVLLVYDNLYCSGTLVRSKIVITVASCLLTDQIKRPIVKIGSDSITGNGQVIPVVDIKIHEYYKYTNKIDNDIAMLVLKDDVRFSDFVKKAILVEPEVALRPGVIIEVSGWGSSNLHQNYLNRLLWVEMVVINKEECAESLQDLLSGSNFCAKYQPDRRLSDNGGPALYDRDLVVGLLSHGGISVDEPHVAILTNVSYFNRWILLNTKRFLEKYCVGKDSSSSSDGSSESSSYSV